MQVGFKTDRGSKRAVNEDALFVMPKQQIYIVADGVGGHNSGELASRTAVASIAVYIDQNPIPQTATSQELKGYFLECLRVVNMKIFTMSQAEDENKGMATTVVLAYIVENVAYVVNVGDSRAYLVRQTIMEQVTEDHSYVNELVKSGKITHEEAIVHPERNKITRA
ncbi:MAG: protein phosphatase 2C domain-containing protein, partial [Anaerovorax sp.]